MSRSILLFLSLTFNIITTILAQTAARANTCNVSKSNNHGNILMSQ